MAWCCGEGWLTRDGRPRSSIERYACSMPGNATSSLVQCATDASSHQCARLRIADWCGSAERKAFIDASSRQAVAVQKVRRASL